MKKFFGTLRVIVEAEDWNEAYDFLDELVKTDPPLEIAAYDAKITASDIDYLRQTPRGSLVGRSTKRDLKTAGMV